MRKKAMTLVLTVVMLLALTAGIALARTFTCPDPGEAERACVGTKKADNITGTPGVAEQVIRGLDGADVIRGGNGDDEIFGGRGPDTISDTAGRDVDGIAGGPGNDTINIRDGDRPRPRPNDPTRRETDEAACGPGIDTVIRDANDGVEPDCENVSPPVAPEAP